MPTTSWIIETAEERFWEGLPPVPSPPYFPCPYCEKQFASPLEIEEHIKRSHFLDLPALLLRGDQVPGEAVIRTSVRETDVQLVNCTSCRVRIDAGETRSLSASHFRRLFAKERYAHWEIHLTNAHGSEGSRSEREYRLDFRITERRELDEADRFFIQYLAVDRPKHKDIDLFATACCTAPSARDYIGALSNYVLGVMIKEQEGDLVAPLGFDEYKSKFLEARSVLRDFDRPVAQAITSCVDFNLNGFTGEEVASRLYALRAGHGLFRAVAQASAPSPYPPDSAPRYSAAVCPVDTVTDSLLAVSERYMRGARLSVNIAAKLSRSSITRSISEYDLPKVHVLCALIYLKTDNFHDAQLHLRQLQFDSLFGKWARNRMEDKQ